jgi:hypothetical protein
MEISMATFTFSGNQIGEALQFQNNGLNTTVEIGQTWFSATDTVTMTTAPGTTDATGAFIGGAGAITSLTVTTATGQVTTFVTGGNRLDVDPDPDKQGADFFFISESPTPGVGGAYAGLQLEKILVSDVGLAAGFDITFGTPGGFNPGTGPVTPPVVQARLIGDGADNTLWGTEGANYMAGRAGNDTILARGGNDTVDGDQGNDRINGGNGNDQLFGGEGNDLLLGGSGADRLFGGDGNDVLNGGAGRDQLAGGFGGDTFVFGAGDRVLDFNASQGDQIAFNAALGLDLSDITVTVGANATTISYNGGSMTLNGVTRPFDLGNAFDFGYVPSFDFV